MGDPDSFESMMRRFRKLANKKSEFSKRLEKLHREKLFEHWQEVEKCLEGLVVKGYLIDDLKIVREQSFDDGVINITTTIIYVPSGRVLTTLN